MTERLTAALASEAKAARMMEELEKEDEDREKKALLRAVFEVGTA
jgi:hypothetical protein